MDISKLFQVNFNNSIYIKQKDMKLPWLLR